MIIKWVDGSIFYVKSCVIIRVSFLIEENYENEESVRTLKIIDAPST